LCAIRPIGVEIKFFWMVGPIGKVVAMSSNQVFVTKLNTELVAMSGKCRERVVMNGLKRILRENVVAMRNSGWMGGFKAPSLNIPQESSPHDSE
jgi:hypothetical protein